MDTYIVPLLVVLMDIDIECALEDVVPLTLTRHEQFMFIVIDTDNVYYSKQFKGHS